VYTTVLSGGNTGTTASTATSAPSPQGLPTSPSSTSSSTTRTTRNGPADAPDNPTTEAIVSAYEHYLGDLSLLDDNLNSDAVGPLASVTTTRLAQASVRQAAALQGAQEHGVGILHDDHVKVVMTGSDSASLVDCQDEDHFYLVEDGTGTADPFVARGYFVGSAQMVLQQGHWLVDVFTTTHVTCTY